MKNTWILHTIEQLPAGAFLIVDGNPMTIGWAQFGVIWGKLCCTVYVRDSRYTHKLLESADSFTISVPALGTYKKELAKCGTLSGRDINKMELCNLSFLPDRMAIKGCAVHIFARILNRERLEPSSIDPNITSRYYPSGGAHTAYIAEITDVYEEEL
ncbi:MAG: flavin reductase family protein [Clostridia bacterium]|nr:flavin reductase family protein [Clostridia bacterium]